MSRRDAINSLFLKKPETPAPSPVKAPDRVRTGAIAAMGSSLQEMTESVRAADRLQQQLASGEAVVSLEPGQIDGSVIADRIHIDVDPGFDELVASIAENGQQVPILVRPHPEKAGRFQIAYGRRRLRAAAQLGRPVQAIVRNLTDNELVVAQGRENLDRNDLSFIEKALFAKHLEDAGYDRQTIIAALSTDKGDLSRYIAIARRIPEAMLRRIGPASKVGRARWLGLAERLGDAKTTALIERVLNDPAVLAMDSDTRFQEVWKALSKPQRPTTSKASAWLTPDGKRAGLLERRGGKTAVVFNDKV
ncbi:plasmid partitioning protein RepB, partial [Mesorhizobium sp. M1A.F.Ca.IN.022.05.2.1]|uniref:plasmid partitioning protein RepB n=1 Tax=Mesorhizobium sp. M1A.F.Ca.IN.022.05.2.1 TaxID=2496760 RepID=UPI000FCAA393